MQDSLIIDFAPLSPAPVGAADVYAKLKEAGVKTLLFESEELGPLGSEDALYERCRYTFFREDGSIYDNGKYACGMAEPLFLF